MGAFDDLIPQSQSSGSFDDLIPQSRPLGKPEELTFAEKAGQALSEMGDGVVGKVIEAVAPYARGFVQGAADPVVGAAQLGANLIGQGDSINKAIAEKEAFNQAQGTSEGARIVGNIASPAGLYAASRIPVLTGATGFAPKLTQLGKNVGIGAGTGAAFGAVAPVTDTTQDYADQKLDQMGVGALIGGALPVGAQVLKGTGIVAGGLTDLIRGRLGTLQAAKAVRASLPDEAAAMRAFASAPDDLTAAQVAQQAGVAGPTFQGFGARAQQMMPDDYNAIMARQEAARLSGLQAETPDLAAAVAQREGAANVTYGNAYASDAQRRAMEDAAAEAQALLQSGGIAGYGTKAPIPPQIQALSQNPIIAAAAREAGILARASGLDVPNPMGSLEGLHLMKLAIDNQFKNRSASTALQNYSDDALRNSKAQLLAAIEGTTNQPGISPLYGLARKQYAALSPEVNQAQVMGELQTTLRKSGDVGERRTQFLAQTEPTGAAALSMLKRADQSPRNVGEIADVLTPAQMAAVKKVRGDFSRDILMEKAAKEGGQAATKALQDVNLAARLPSFFDKWITFINKGLASTEERISEETLKALAEGMKSGKKLNKMLMELPATERSRVLKGMLKAERVVPYATSGAVGMSREQ